MKYTKGTIVLLASGSFSDRCPSNASLLRNRPGARPSIGLASCILVAAVLFSGDTGNAQNLVKNGSFELGALLGSDGTGDGSEPTGPLFTNAAYGVTPYTGLTSWNVYALNGDGYAISDPTESTYFMYPAYDGLQAVGYANNKGSSTTANGQIYLTQSISELTPGDSYTLTFYQASSGRPWDTHWTVGFGTDTFASPEFHAQNIDTPTSWEKVTHTFTAKNSTQTLSFLSGPTGQPLFLYLDGVSLTPTNPAPEPSSLLLLGASGSLILFRRRRKS